MSKCIIKRLVEDRPLFKTASPANLVRSPIEDPNEVTAEFGPGTYHLGDICYCLKDDIYDNVWCDKYSGQPGVFEVKGSKFVVDHTAYGDGEFRGSDRRIYWVDAGNIGIVPKALWDFEKSHNGNGFHWDSSIFVAKQGVTFLSSNGLFKIIIDGKNPITINTA